MTWVIVSNQLLLFICARISTTTNNNSSSKGCNVNEYMMKKKTQYKKKCQQPNEESHKNGIRACAQEWHENEAICKHSDHQNNDLCGINLNIYLEIWNVFGCIHHYCFGGPLIECTLFVLSLRLFCNIVVLLLLPIKKSSENVHRSPTSTIAPKFKQAKMINSQSFVWYGIANSDIDQIDTEIYWYIHPNWFPKYGKQKYDD